MAHQEGVPCGRKTQQQAGSRIAKYLHRKKRSRESKLDGTLKAHTSDILLPARKATSAKPPQRVSPTGDQVFIELRLWGTLVIQTATDGSGSGTKWRHEKTNDPNQKIICQQEQLLLAIQPSGMLEELHTERTACCIQPDSNANCIQ